MSPEEVAYVWVSNGYDIHLPVISDSDSAGVKGNGRLEKVTGAIKVPDAVFGLIDPATNGEEDAFPRIIVEGALPQSYTSVMEDVPLWLARSQGQVKLVIIVKLQETKGARKMVDREGFSQKHREHIAVRKAFDEHELVETLTGYDFNNNQWFEHSNLDWVRPLQGCVEFYRLSSDRIGIVKEGQSYISLINHPPPPSCRISMLTHYIGYL